MFFRNRGWFSCLQYSNLISTSGALYFIKINFLTTLKFILNLKIRIIIPIKIITITVIVMIMIHIIGNIIMRNPHEKYKNLDNDKFNNNVKFLTKVI